MRGMLFGLMLALAACAVGRAEGPMEADGQGDVARLQGVWKLVQGRDEAVAVLMTVEKDVMTIALDAKGSEVEDQGAERVIFKLGRAKEAKEIDLAGPDKEGRKTLGIYDLEGDTLKICVGPGSGERPKALMDDASGSRLQTWKRVK